MEENLDLLARQAKNNINIIDIKPLDVDNKFGTFKLSVRYEFQWRPKEANTPHWTKSCMVIDMVHFGESIKDKYGIDEFSVGDAITMALLSAVKKARKELER